MNPPENLPIFVYGTLKRGQCRERCWPIAPLEVVPAAVQGSLYDLERYPALLPGQDWVRGELWTLAADAVAETLRVLDEVEGYLAGTDDEYRRTVVPVVRLAAGCAADAVRPLGERAYVYHYTGGEVLTERQRRRPGADGFCCWP